MDALRSFNCVDDASVVTENDYTYNRNYSAQETQRNNSTTLA